jgi:DNA-binding HxlR family transcriptional regulator
MVDGYHCCRGLIHTEEGTFMSDENTGVPSLVATPLAERVPLAEYEACSVTGLFHRLGDKWSLLTLVLLGARPHRFNELHHRIEGISQRMLTRTLRSLESGGLVRRTVHPTVPPSVEYALTPPGQALLGPLSQVANWAVEHYADATTIPGTEGSPARGEKVSRNPSAPSPGLRTPST